MSVDFLDSSADELQAPKDDSTIVTRVRKELGKHAGQGIRHALIETAGGVLSPSPSGTVQADLYRPLRLPSLLVGDSKLGGIATTISAYESLYVRGYDVDEVILLDDPAWGNFEYLREHFQKHNVETHPLPLPPPRLEDPKSDSEQMSDYYAQCSESPVVTNLLDILNNKHFSRVSKVTSLPSQADSVIWHPFRQHGIQHNIIAIDSAYDDHFEAYNQESDPVISSTSTSPSSLTNLPPQLQPLTTPLFDASASWWTQGLGHGNPNLSLTAAHAAGRYGHVMFAHAVHEPALDLCYNLLFTLQNPRLARVFFTDNGSTGMEVAVKMALRASCQRYGWNKDDASHPVGILGLKGSYHGDTIGVMNCSEPSVFNDKVDWYKPWGCWFDPPSILMRNGTYQIAIPDSFSGDLAGQTLSFPALDSIFDFSSRSAHAAFYKSYITTTLTSLRDAGHRFGALILEPLIMGAGGMIFVDPLFQATLISTIRSNPSLISSSATLPTDAHDWSGLPFIADEVFTGLYRLGRPSSSSFLAPDSSTAQRIPSDIAPDISVHAKLLTGGLLPLALTTASNSIFNTFLSDSKTDALLHGHSYTAHPVGCAVANKALEQMSKLHSSSTAWQHARSAWSSQSDDAGPDISAPVGRTAASRADVEAQATGAVDDGVWSFFSPIFLDKLSRHELIEGCFAVGTVLAMTMKSTGGGYSSTATASLQKRLLTTLDSTGSGIHSRVLGDVLYVMTSLVTEKEMVRRLEGSLMKALDAEAEEL